MSEIVQAPNFDDMPIGKLREYASHMRVALAKTATKVEIIEALNNKVKGRAVAELATADNVLKPGYARIRLNEDPMPGASNMPAYVNANGYECTIPRGVEVVVPMRVVRTLNDAVVRRKKQSISMQPGGREAFQETEIYVLSYPFQVLEMNPGPDVLTTLEMQKQRTFGPRKRYHELFGRWPRPADLQRALEKGLIKVHDNEEPGIGVERLLETNK